MHYLEIFLGVCIGVICEKLFHITKKIKEYQEYRKTQKGAK